VGSSFLTRIKEKFDGVETHNFPTKKIFKIVTSAEK